MATVDRKCDHRSWKHLNPNPHLAVAQVSGTTANNGDIGTSTILDEATPDPTFVSITGPASVTENASVTYDIVIDNAPLTDVIVTFTYSGSASDGTDYTGVASATILAGSTTASVTIQTIDDSLGEPLEDFTIAIDSVTGGSLEDLQIDPIDFEVTTDIVDNDTPTISVSDVIVTEGSDAFAQPSVSQPTETPLTLVSWGSLNWKSLMAPALFQRHRLPSHQESR